MYTKNILLAFLGLFVFSCTNSVLETEEPTSSNLLEGYWINGELADTIYAYQRADSLSGNQYCFGLETNGVFVENKNAGWCGTPPVYYQRFTGEWSLNDSILTVSVPYWGGMSHYTWKIVNVDEETLVYVVLATEYEHADP